MKIGNIEIHDHWSENHRYDDLVIVSRYAIISGKTAVEIYQRTDDRRAWIVNFWGELWFIHRFWHDEHKWNTVYGSLQDAKLEVEKFLIRQARLSVFH